MRFFFEFVRILREAREYNPNVKFLLENVVMKKEYQQVITDMLGVEPIMINSALVSAQNRKRLYWTNIKGVTQPEDRGILLKDILEEDVEAKFVKDTSKYDGGRMLNPNYSSQANTVYETNRKSPCLNAFTHGYALGYVKIKTDTGFMVRMITPVECEKLQTVPFGYTKGVSDTQGYKMLGNGWTIDVITHILSFMKTES